MNEFHIKKIGEILAFDSILRETLSENEKPCAEIFAHFGIEEVKNKNQEQIKHLMEIAPDKQTEILKRSEKSAEKIRKMKELYLGEKANDTAEMSEWLGFFEGAALAHFNVVGGIAEEIKDKKLRKVAKDGIEFHTKLFKTINETAREIGSQR